MLKSFLLVGAGGMVGSMLRYAFYVILKSSVWTTFSVNIIGSFAIGLIIGYAQRIEHPQNMQLLLATGVCGGFTTFSAFSADNVRLFNEGNIGTALIYSALSVVLGVLFTFIGYKLV